MYSSPFLADEAAFFLASIIQAIVIPYPANEFRTVLGMLMHPVAAATEAVPRCRGYRSGGLLFFQ